MELQINGYSLTLRKSEAAMIKVEECSEPEDADVHTETVDAANQVPHPGLGEEENITPKTTQTLFRGVLN